jgi:hypothetical protein
MAAGGQWLSKDNEHGSDEARAGKETHRQAVDGDQGQNLDRTETGGGEIDCADVRQIEQPDDGSEEACGASAHDDPSQKARGETVKLSGLAGEL